MACQEATKTTPSQARCWLASRLLVNGVKWSSPAMIGMELEMMKVKT